MTPLFSRWTLLAVAVATLGLSGASRADESWIRIGSAGNPNQAYVENHNGLDLGTQWQQSLGRACYVACPLVELRMRARQNASGLASAHSHSTMLYSLTQANGQPLTPGELFALSSVVLRFKVTGRHGLPPLGSVAFTHSAMATPVGAVSGAGRLYEGRNERTATGTSGESTLTQYRLNKPAPKVTHSSQMAEMDGTRFAIEVPATATGWLEWSVSGQVDGGSPAEADYRIVLLDVLYTGAGVPGAGMSLGQSQVNRYVLKPRNPDGGLH